MAGATHLVVFSERPRNIELRGPGARHRVAETEWHHADDLPRLLAQIDGLPDCVGRAAEAALPEGVAQDDDSVATFDLIVCREAAPQQRGNSKRRKKLPRHALRGTVGRLVVRGL